jgi:hypothetical protein
LLLYYKKRKTIKARYLIFIGISLFIIGFPALQGYLFTFTAPRAILLKYGFITANTYFPLGAGFATYGSDMARRYYSLLYWKYEFNTRFAMSQLDGRLLDDNYFAMIIGQFGWFGFIIFLSILYKIYVKINQSNAKRVEKAITVSVIITIFITMIYSATSKSIMCVWVFLIIGIMTVRKNSMSISRNNSA